MSEANRERGFGVTGENYSGSYGGVVSCTEVRARVVLTACGGVVSSSLRSSSVLTFQFFIVLSFSLVSLAFLAPDQA